MPYVVTATLAGCGRIERLDAEKQAHAMAAKHLNDVRALATHVELTCATVPWTVSPAKGTAVDHDPTALEVEVRCVDRSIVIHGKSEWSSHANLRGTTPPASASYYTPGVGKDEAAGTSATGQLEEYGRVPSSIVADAIDICVHREGGGTAVGIEVCVAYSTR